MKAGTRNAHWAALLIAAVCFSAVAAAQSDDEEAAVAGDIEMAWIVSAAARAAIEEVWRNTRSFPADRTETGMSPTPSDTSFGPVAALDVTDGHVFVTFGGEAHPTLLGKSVVFSPTVTPNQNIEWMRNRSMEVPAEDRHGWVRAPVDMIGNSPDSWQEFLGADTQLHEKGSCIGENTIEPIVCVGLAGSDTEAHFVKNLSSGREFLIYLESSSQTLLTSLGVNTIPIGEDRVARLERCWEAGCDVLEVVENPGGTRSATWSYYVE